MQRLNNQDLTNLATKHFGCFYNEDGPANIFEAMHIFLTDIEMTNSPLYTRMDTIYGSMFSITEASLLRASRRKEENNLRKAITPDIRDMLIEIRDLMNQKEHQAASDHVGGFPIKKTNDFLRDIGLEPLPEWHAPKFNNEKAHGISHLIAA